MGLAQRWRLDSRGVIATPGCLFDDALHRVVTGAGDEVLASCEPRIPALDGFLALAGRAAHQMVPHCGRHDVQGARAIERSDGIRERRGISNRRTRSDDGRIVLDRRVHIGDRERHRRSGNRGEPSPLDCGQMLANAVDGRNRQAALEKRPGGLNFVSEREPISWRGEHGGSAARQQHHQRFAGTTRLRCKS